MEKWFYYRVNLVEAFFYVCVLADLEIPFLIEIVSPGQLVLLFPDLPIRQFNVVQWLLGALERGEWS